MFSPFDKIFIVSKIHRQTTVFFSGLEVFRFLWYFDCFTALIEKLQSEDNMEGPSVQLLKEALINTRQHEAFLRVILVGVLFRTVYVYCDT